MINTRMVLRLLRCWNYSRTDSHPSTRQRNAHAHTQTRPGQGQPGRPRGPSFGGARGGQVFDGDPRGQGDGLPRDGAQRQRHAQQAVALGRAVLRHRQQGANC